MNTSQLECFVTLAGTLNYVKTADQLGLTQPSVSKQIQSLETELGERLFFRTTRSVSLTQVGARFLPEATSMLNTYYHSKELIANFRHHTGQSLRIGYSDPHIMYRISQILKLLMPLNENIRPELSYDQTDANLSKLTQGLLDIVIGMRDARFSDDRIIFKKVMEDSFCCVIGKNHPETGHLSRIYSTKKCISTEDVWPIRQIISIPPYLVKQYFSRGRNIVPVNDDLSNIVCSNVNEAYALVMASLGYAFVPGHLAVRHPDIEVFSWKESPQSAFGIYYRKSFTNEKETVVREFIKKAVAIYTS